jgi:hypothetical protein
MTASMPRSNFPLTTRMKAMPSRCRGFMFAWILNTKPVNRSSSGRTHSWSSVSRGAGGAELSAMK